MTATIMTFISTDMRRVFVRRWVKLAVNFTWPWSYF